jgi:predicted ester cyclase
MTSPSPVLSLLLDGFAALHRGDVDAAAELLSPDFRIHHAGQPEQQGREAWAHGARLMLAAFPDVRLDVEDAVEAGDTLAVRVRVTGTHRGEFAGVPATGRRVEYVSHEFYRAEGDRLTAEWICSDLGGLFAQLTAA